MRGLCFCGIFFPKWVFFALVVLCAKMSSAQPTWSWAEGVIGGSDQRGAAIATDVNGNSCSTGYFKGSADFDGIPLTTSGNEDGYVTKYDANGNGIWAVNFGGSGEERGSGIAIDASGNVYVCGMVDGVTTFYGSPNIVLTPAGNTESFVAKFSSSGQVLWVKHISCTNADEALAVCTDGNNVYVTGFFSGTATFGALTPLTSSGGEDVFIAAYSCLAGTEQWAVKGGSTGNDRGDGIAVDASGVYVGGFYTNATITFQNQSGSLASIGATDIFVVKYNLAGTGLWQRRAGSNSNDEGNCLTLGGNAVYVGGFFDNTMNLYNSGPAVVATITSANNHDGCIIKYDATTGNYGWVVSENGQGDDHIYDISCAPSGVVYATGAWNGTLPFGAGPAVTSASEDVFVTCYSSAGVFLTGMRATGNDNEEGFGISATYADAVYVTGYFKSTSTVFGTTPSLNASSEDIFISKILCGVTVAAAGSDQSVCSSSVVMNGNIPSAGTGTWTLVSGSGTIVSPSSPTSSITGLGVGANVFRWTIMSGPCVSYDEVSITRDLPPSTAFAGADQTLCSSSAFLNAVNPFVGNGLWTLLSGTATITNPNSDNTTVTGLGTGANVFQWTTSNGICPVSVDTISITVDAMPTIASAGPDQTVCSSSSIMSGNTPLVGNGIWSVINSNGTFTAPGSPVSSVNNLDPGINIFRWTISNGTCPSSHDTVMIQSDTPPSVASAGPDQTICSSGAFINANNPSSGTGLWSLVTGSGTITNPGSDNTTLTGLGAGANIFQWMITNGVCPASSDSITITVDENPTPASAGSDDILCTSSHQLSGNIPLVGSGTWSVLLGGGNIVNPNSANSMVNALPFGINVFRWTISNGVCPSSSDDVQLSIDIFPTPAVAGADHSRCDVVDTLSGNIPLIGTGVWSLLSGSGTIVNPSSPLSPVTGLGVGANDFTWTISNGICPSSIDTITIIRDEDPSQAVAGPDENNCSPADTLNGNIPLIGNGTWSVIAGAGSVTNPSSAATEITNLSVGQNTFVWTISNGVCPVAVDTVVVVYNEFPSLPNAGSDILACNEQVTMQAQSPTIGSGLWQPVAGSPVIPDGTNPFAVVPLLAPGDWTYTWTTQNGFCISEPDTVSITVFSLPDTAIAGDDRITYVTNIELNAVALDSGMGTWTFVQGSGSIADIHDPHTEVSGLATGTNILRWTAANGTCPENYDDLRIEVLQLIVPQGYSPNGDGVNDHFEITGLDEFANPTLNVFNRWGNEVYVSSLYTNDWNGTDVNGNQLPDDVYYYVLKADELTIFTGYIVLKRNVP